MTKNKDTKKKLLIVLGTRPEAIKLAPLINEAIDTPSLEVIVCSTGQHKEMLSQVLELFEITPDYDLEVMSQNQTLTGITSRIMTRLQSVIEKEKPDAVLVHGDTNTTLTSSLVAYQHRIPVYHVEAGLRSHNLDSPWPEEANRRATTLFTSHHFAPTKENQKNLLSEGVLEQNITVTGNTVIDALLLTCNQLDQSISWQHALNKKFPSPEFEKDYILVTGHRRENLGSGIENICQALLQISHEYPDVNLVYPVHLNPKVALTVDRLLSETQNIKLLPPQDYVSFVHLMRNAHIILTDSGGIQEEAPAFGKPVLVMRDTTERQEGVNAGTLKLVGTNPDKICSEVKHLMQDIGEYTKYSKTTNPYGDGQSSKRIINKISEIIFK